MKYVIILILFLPIVLFPSTIITEDISQNTIFDKAGSPYLIKRDISIYEDIQLYIDEGVKIVVDKDRQIEVDGYIETNSNSSESVTFTSESNWGGIVFQSAYSSKIYNTVFEKAGISRNQNASILINDGVQVFENCKFYGVNSHLIYVQRNGSVDLGGFISKGQNRFNTGDNRYAVFNRTKNPIKAKNNCWEKDVELLIYDKNDNDNFGEVEYLPILDCSIVPEYTTNLIEPIDNIVLYTGDHTLRWEAVSKAEVYYLQISRDTSFSNPVEYELTSTNKIYEFTEAGEYYWRVGVLVKNEIYYSSIRTINFRKIINPPNVISGIDTTVINSCEIMLEWDTVNSEFYMLEIKDTKSSESFIIDSITENKYIYSGLEEFEWKVAGEESDAISLWSEFNTVKFENKFQKIDVDHHKNIRKIKSRIIVLDSNNVIIYSNKKADSVSISGDKGRMINLPGEEVLFINNKKELIRLNIINNTIVSRYEFDGIINDIEISNNNYYDFIASVSFDESDQLLMLNENYEIIDNYIINEKIFNIICSEYNNEEIIYLITENKINIIDIDSLKPVYEGEINEETFLNLSSGNEDYLIGNNDNNLFLMQFNGETLEVNIPIANKRINSFLISEFDNDYFPEILINGDQLISSDLNELEIRRIDTLSIIPDKIQSLIINEAELNLYSNNSVYLKNKCANPIYGEVSNIQINNIEKDISINWNEYLASSYCEIEIIGGNLSEAIRFFKSNGKLILNDLQSGVYTFRVREHYLNGNVSNWSDFFELKTWDQVSLPPTDWQFSVLTGLNSIVVVNDITNFNIGDRTLQLGDAVGFFFMDNGKLKCGGYSVIDSSTANLITIWGDNTNTSIKDGFDNDESFFLKIWDSKLERELVLKPIFSEGPDRFVNNSISYLSSYNSPDTSIIELEKGWNYVSISDEAFYGIPDSVFTNPFQFVQNSDNEQYRFSNVNNTLTELEYNEAYKVYSPESSTISYLSLSKEFTSKFYDSNKWQYVLNINNYNVSIEEMLLPIQDDIILAESSDGRIYYPQSFINEIETVKSQEALKVYFNSSSVYVYPELELNNAEIEYTPNECDASSYGEYMHLIVKEIPNSIKEIRCLNGRGEILYCKIIESSQEHIIIPDKSTNNKINSEYDSFVIQMEGLIDGTWKEIFPIKVNDITDSELFWNEFQREEVFEITFENTNSIEEELIYSTSDLYKIYNSLGQKIYESEQYEPSIKNNLKSGAYYLIVEKGDDFIVTKFIVVN